jgi:acylphosphatase
MENARLHAMLRGRVQGVGFRYFVLENAIAQDLTGWVRNRWDGSVEVTAEGARPVLEQFLAILRKGPSMANVSDAEVEWETASGEFSGFNARSTA